MHTYRKKHQAYAVNQINFIKPYMSLRILYKQLDILKFQNVLRVSLYFNVTSLDIQYWDIGIFNNKSKIQVFKRFNKNI